MIATLPQDESCTRSAPFDLDDDEAYQRWRDWKLAQLPQAHELVVNVRDPRDLSDSERRALLALIGRGGFAIYRSPVDTEDASLPIRLAAQLGMQRLNANWLAHEDGISRIAVSGACDGQGGFIPYTDRAIGWHTDGYYHPDQRRIRGMVLHCVRPALSGGENALLDHELAYIAVRDRAPRLLRALMHPHAMTIPARADEEGVARAAQSGPVFSVDEDGAVHMRYTARARSIEWREDAATREAAALLREVMQDSPAVRRVRLQSGMGMVGHNVLHDRSAFTDDPARPRLILRGRFIDRVDAPEAPWRNG